MTRRGRAYLKAVALAVGSIIALAACASPEVKSTPDAAETTPSSSSPAPVIDELDTDASTEDALRYFDAVNTDTLKRQPDAGGRDFIDALVAAGFDKAAMQVTQDYSTVGNRAESMQFSVRWADSCLIGQNGPDVDGYHSATMDLLAGGVCLVGQTRALDW